MTTPNINTAVFKAPSTATTGRALADQLGDVLNVKSFGALGNGLTDDSAAFQACFDAAFKTGGVEHGVTNAHLNKPIFIPGGDYLLNTTLTLTNVYGGHIFGEGRFSSNLHSNQSGSIIVTNGFSNCAVHDLGLEGSVDDPVGWDLDWDNSKASGLGDNLFYNINISAVIAMRIGFSGNGGANNQIIASNLYGTDTGLLVCGADALNNSVMHGGWTGVSSAAIKVTAGQVSSVINVAFDVASAWGFDIQTSHPIAIMSCRTEGANFFKGSGSGRVYMAANYTTQLADGTWIDLTDYECMMDACSASSDTNDGVAVGSGNCKLYLRSCNVAGTFFDAYTSGTCLVVQNI